LGELLFTIDDEEVRENSGEKRFVETCPLCVLQHSCFERGNIGLDQFCVDAGLGCNEWKKAKRVDVDVDTAELAKFVLVISNKPHNLSSPKSQ